MNEKQIKPLLLALCLASGSAVVYAGDGHDHEKELSGTEQHVESSHEEIGGHAEDEEEGVIHLSEKQRQMIGLEVTPVTLALTAATIRVPGEVTLNAYRSSVVTPRSDVRVVKRHVLLGDHLKAGQPMVTLFSNALADRMTDLRLATKEWELVRKMGRELAGKQRYVAANSGLLQTLAQVTAFGLSKTEIERQLNNPAKAPPLGEFVLRAPHDGVVQKDNFLVGQQMSAGDPLFVLVDEGEVWVEAQVSPNQSLNVAPGTPVTLQIGGQKFIGDLKQVAHTIDEQTRTRMVRIAIQNDNHQLHPGQFAQVDVPTDAEQMMLVLPESAFTRTADGDWGVFVEKAPGEYALEEVDVERELRGRRIVSGIEPGTPVVTAGTFFLASEQAKAGFDIHNH